MRAVSNTLQVVTWRVEYGAEIVHKSADENREIRMVMLCSLGEQMQT